MDREKQIENFRILWEQIMVGIKLEVCTDELKGAGILDVNILKLLFNILKLYQKKLPVN